MSKKIKPTLWIYYSWTYDQNIHTWQGKKWKKEYEKAGRAYREELNNAFAKVAGKVFDLIAKHSTFSWKRPLYEAFVVRECIPFNHPLTISRCWVGSGKKFPISEGVETIIHELIHIIEQENDEKIRWNKTKIIGKSLPEIARYHLLTFAIEWLVLVDIFGEKVARPYMDSYSHMKDYRQAINVVQKYGAKNIIGDLVKK
jgi:hypothetical protein